METLRNFGKVLICTYIIGLFLGCKAGNESQMVEFFSLMELNRHEEISIFFKNEDLTNDLCHILCLRNESKKKLDSYACNCDSLQISDNIVIKKERILHDIILKKDTCANCSYLLDRLEEFNWGTANLIEIYQTIKYLKVKALVYSELEQFIEAEASLLYGFHLLEKNNLKEKFPFSYFSMLNAIQYLWATEGKHLILQMEINKLVQSGADQYGFVELHDDAIYRQIDMMTIPDSFDLNQIFGQNEITDLGLDIKINIASSLAKSLYLPEDQLIFNQCLELMLSESRDSDIYYYIIDLLTIADIYAYDFKFDTAQYYIEEAKDLILEEHPNQTWLKTYYLESKMTYYENQYYANDYSEDLDSAIHYMTLMNDIIESIYSDKSVFHYNDILVEQVLDLMHLLKSENNISNNLQEKVLDGNHIAKNQELKFQSQHYKILKDGESSQLGDINKKINEIYLESNELTNLDLASDVKYKTFYDLVEERQKIRKRVQEEDDFKTYPIKSEEIFEFVKRENCEIVEYISSDEETALYHLSSKGMRISIIPNNILDSVVYEVLLAIERKIKIEDITSLKSLILPFELNNNASQLIILKSGLLEKIPFNIMDINTPIRYSNDLNEVLDNEVLEIDKESFWVQCFSNNETIKDRSKKKYLELIDGFTSSSRIVNNLSIEQENFCSGRSSSFDKFKLGCSKDGLHLITHGISDESVKNKNYLIFRSKNGGYEKVSSVDLDYLPSYPKFIFLDACDTGIGKIEVGEGSYSLGRVFLKNGTSTIIKTLWKIDDETAGYFSDEFYKGWTSGLSVYEAFTKAQSKLKEDFKDPYYWAPFVLEGNPNVYLSKN